MKFQHHKKCLTEQIYAKLLVHLQVEPGERSRYFQLLSYIFYILDYVTLISLIFITKNHYTPPFPNSFIYVHLAIIAVLALLYLKMQAQLILVLKKMVWLASCYLFQPAFNYIAFPVLLVSLAGWAVWAFTIEKRTVHYDSRLSIRYPFYKMATMECLLVLMTCTDVRLDLSVHHSFFLAFVGLWIFIDYNQIIYNRVFKECLLLTDLCLLISCLVDFFNKSTLNSSFDTMQEGLLLGVNMVCAYVILYLSRQDYHILFSVNPFSGKHSDATLLEYFLKLDYLCECPNSFLTNKFMFHHLRECEDAGCFLHSYYSMRKELNITINQSLRRFFFETVQHFAERNQLIRDYMVHRGYQRSELLKPLLDFTNFFHYRAHDRMLKEFAHITQSNTSGPLKMEILDLDKIIEDTITSSIKNYLDNSICFWKELLEYRIDIQKLYNCASEQMDSLKKIQKFIANNEMISEGKRMKLNEFMCYICRQANNPLNTSLRITQKYLSDQVEAPPTLLISAEKDDFMKIVDVNVATTKYTGFSREELIGLSIQNLWNEDLRETHKKFVIKRSKECVFDFGKVRRTYAFMTNKFGYLVFVDGFVHYVNDIEGKKWCVILEPCLVGEAIFVCNSHREIVGVNEFCTYMGMNKEMVGSKVDDEIFEEALNKKLGTKLKGRALLNQRTTGFDSNPKDTITLKFLSEVSFPQVTFFAFTINKKAVFDKRYSSMYRESLMAADMNNSINNSSKNTDLFASRRLNPPNFEFSYDFNNAMFTNYQVPQMYQHGCTIAFDDQKDLMSQSQRSEHKIDEITEMRIFQGKIDFIQNMPDTKANLDRFQKIPWARQLEQHKQISEDKYKEVAEKRLKQVPISVILLRGFFIGIIVAILCATVITLVMQSHNHDTLTKKQKVYLYANQQFENMVVLGIRTLGIYYQPEANISKIILQKISQIEDVYKKLSIEETNFNDRLSLLVGGQTLQTIINNYRLALNDFLNSPTKNQAPILNILRNKIYPGWSTLMHQLYLEVNSLILANKKLNTVSLGLTIGIVIVLILLYWKLIRYIANQYKQICIVFKTIPEHYIQHYIQKVQSFKKYIQLGNTYIEDQALQNIQMNEDADNQQNQYRKRLVNSISFFLPNALFCLCCLTLTGHFVRSNLLGAENIDVHQNYIRMSSVVYDVSIEAEMIWSGLNMFPYDVPLLDFYEDRMYTADIILQHEINKGIELHHFSPIFYNFLKVFTHEDSCSLFTHPDCPTELNGALHNGIKQMYTYLFRKYDAFMHHVFQPEEFRALQDAQTVYYVQKRYLENISGIFNSKISKEDLEKDKTMKQRQFVGIGFCIASLMLSVGSFALLHKIARRIQQVEVLLSFLPFEFIRKNHSYWNMTIKGYSK